jgi:hypothetical protein
MQVATRQQPLLVAWGDGESLCPRSDASTLNAESNGRSVYYYRRASSSFELKLTCRRRPAFLRASSWRPRSVRIGRQPTRQPPAVNQSAASMERRHLGVRRLLAARELAVLVVNARGLTAGRRGCDRLRRRLLARRLERLRHAPVLRVRHIGAGARNNYSGFCAKCEKYCVVQNRRGNYSL